MSQHLNMQSERKKMPTYTIHDTKKDEFFDTICTWGELQLFLDENQQSRKIITEPNIVYASGRDGAWVSTDFGNTWASIINDSVHKNRPKGNVAEGYYLGISSDTMKMYISSIEANCNGSKIYIGISGYALLQASN